MNVTVASKTTITPQASGTLAFSKPTGLEVGDLLVAVCFYAETSLTAPTDFSAPAGWTQDAGDVISKTGSNRTQVQIFRKVATSTETAASSLDFTSTTPDATCGELYRITGYRGSDVVGGFAIDSINVDVANPTFSLSFTPDQQETLFILSYVASTIQTDAVISDPVVDMATNPTWTQQFSENPVADTYRTMIFTAEATSTDAITQLTQSVTNASASTDWGAVLIAINDDGNATAENTLIDTDAVTFTSNGIADTETSSVLTSTTSESFAQTGKGDSPQQWTEPTKSTDTWTNKNI